jgi:MFS family permease
VWGIYYEFLGFANQQFVAESVPLEKRSSVWAVLMTFKSLAYFLGPFVAAFLIEKGDRSLLLITACFTVLGYLIFTLMKMKDKKVEIEVEEINIVKELSHWYVLFHRVWPIVLISLVLGLIDATFWTTGAVWSEKLSDQSWWGTLFLPLYTLPSLFMGFVVMKWGSYKKKKRWATRFMFLGGLFLAFLGFKSGVGWQLFFVGASSVMTAVTYPLVEAVYSDIVSRMGRERKHLIGLSNSTTSLAYIIGPILAGGIAQVVGEQMTFSIAGGTMAAVALILLMVMPKKIKVPQQNIKTWDTIKKPS